MILEPDKRAQVIRGLSSPFRNVQLWACRKVAIGKISTAVPELIALLNSKDDEVSVQAAVALEEISLLSGNDTFLAPVQDAPSVSHPQKKNSDAQALRTTRSGQLSAFASLDDSFPGSGTDFSYYLRDSAPLKFAGLTLIIFAVLYCGTVVNTQNSTNNQNNINHYNENHYNENHNGGAKSNALAATGTHNRTQSAKRSDNLPQDTSPSLVFEEYLSSRKAGSVHGGVLGTDTPVSRDNESLKTSSSSATGGSDYSKEEVWLSMATRYLQSGRPRQCIKYCDLLISNNLSSDRARELKRVARERYGVID